MKAALHALEQLNAIAWQHTDSTAGLTSCHKDDSDHESTQKSDALDKLKRSLSMPDQITRDLARPLLASALDEVTLLGTCLPTCWCLCCELGACTWLAPHTRLA